MFRRRLHSDILFLLILIAINLVIGLKTFHDYGESFDEALIYQYAEHSTTVYSHALSKGFVPEPGILDYYGPFFFIFSSLGARLIGLLQPGNPISDNWHLIYFLTFQVGVVLFYILARRWMSTWAALGVTALFSYQPLFWGHAFINPKDIPFMVFFLAVVVTGFHWVDHYPEIPPPLIPRGEKPRRNGWVILLMAVSWIFFVFLLLVGRELLKPWLAFNWILFIIFLSGLSLLVATALLSRWITPELIRTVIKDPEFWLAGILLGITISLRLSGVLAGVLVVVYFFYRRKFFAIPPLVAFSTLSMGILYLSWPFLWSSPWKNLVKVLNYMTRFPFGLKVLFNGNYYHANALPVIYFPELITLQLTEPVLILFLVGFLLATIAVMHKSKCDLLLITLLWFFLPLVGMIIYHPSMYDNFRQFIFLLPPVFLLAGAGLEAILNHIKPAFLRLGIILICILPGIMAGIKLHPYEYIYYNSLTGGVQGAAQRFELDYWCTSYRAAAKYLDQIAPTDARIISWGLFPGLEQYIRPDLRADYFQSEYNSDVHYDYAVLTTRVDADREWFPEAPVIYRVSVEGVTLAVVKEIP